MGSNIKVNRRTALAMGALALLSVTGCSKEEDNETQTAEEPTVVRSIDDAMVPYDEMSDGTWRCDGRSYKYRLETTGRLNNAAADSTYVYLSNLEEITWDQAWKASGLSSDSNDYFDPEDAVLVEMY